MCVRANVIEKPCALEPHQCVSPCVICSMFTCVCHSCVCAIFTIPEIIRVVVLLECLVELHVLLLL